MNKTTEKAWGWYWEIVNTSFINEVVKTPIINHKEQTCCILNTYYCREKKGLIYYKTLIDLLHGTQVKKEISESEYNILMESARK